MSIVDHIFTLFERRGHAAYFEEAVSQLEHALHGMPEDMAAFGVDGQHQDIGAAWLSRHFGTAVTEPIRLHVAAKRYLCAVEEQYQHQLSPASVQSLALQGGGMDAAEVQAFRSREWWSEAVWLRRLDDAAKIAGWRVPDLEHYRTLLQALSRQGRRV